MRVLYVITPSRYSGTEQILLRVAELQQRTGDTVRVLSKPLAPFEAAARDRGVEMVAAPIGGKLNLMASHCIAGHIAQFRPDVVCTYHSTGTLWGVRAAAARGVPAVAMMQAANTPWPYNRAPAATGCAEFVRRHLIEHGMPPERVHTIRNGIDPSAYLDDGDRDAIRSELGLRPDEVAVGTLAHFTPRKAHSDLLQAAALLVPEMPNIRLLWAGEGPLEADLRKSVDRLGLTGHVSFLGFRPDAPRLHRAFDILALPSLNEGLPLVLLEAMASCRPCVATAVAGSPEIVVEGDVGFLVPPREPTAMAAALGRLARDSDLRDRMGRAGRARVMAEFTLAEMVERTRAVLEAEIRCQSARHGRA